MHAFHPTSNAGMDVNHAPLFRHHTGNRPGVRGDRLDTRWLHTHRQAVDPSRINRDRHAAFGKPGMPGMGVGIGDTRRAPSLLGATDQ
jgi:hypothetical protein